MNRLEKVTDIIVFNFLRANRYVDGNFTALNPKVQVWAKKSTNAAINSLLSKASKRSTDKPGFPEYIAKHIYKEIDEKVDEYAVNGALWYASKLKGEFDVIAIGVSGNSADSLMVDTYVWKRQAEMFSNLNIHRLLKIEDYRGAARSFLRWRIHGLKRTIPPTTATMNWQTKSGKWSTGRSPLPN